jgi:DNA-binding CsgD family transcriptional regulator
MVRAQEADSAGDELLAAALLGDGWADGLQQLADAAEAGGATLLRLRNGRPLAVLTSTEWVEAWSAQLAGDIPPSPRRFFPDHVFERERDFVADTAIWTEEELRRDPFYQEFLRPHGVFYHAKARLSADADERVSLSLKRLSKFGPYEPSDIAVLDRLLPKLQMAVRIARRVLDAEASGMVRVLRQRGDPVLELDAFGRVLRVHANGADRLGIVVRQGRMRASDSREQAVLDRAVWTAARAPQEPAVVAVTDEHGERRFLHLVPVRGRARDVFLATAMIAVVIEPPPLAARGGQLADGIRQALGLTTREAQIAALLAEGLSLGEAAVRLRLRVGTARNHLKSVFQKIGVRRQGELVALMSKLSS